MDTQLGPCPLNRTLPPRLAKIQPSEINRAGIVTCSGFFTNSTKFRRSKAAVQATLSRPVHATASVTAARGISTTELTGSCRCQTRTSPGGPGRTRSKIVVGNAVGIKGKTKMIPETIFPRFQDSGSSGRSSRALGERTGKCGERGCPTPGTGGTRYCVGQGKAFQWGWGRGWDEPPFLIRRQLLLLRTVDGGGSTSRLRR